MNQYYYSKEKKTFFHSSVHAKEQMTADAIEISDEQHEKLLSAINKGCIVFDDLTISEPKPSEFHKWDGDKWSEDTEEKELYIKNINQLKIIELTQEVTQKINILQDAINLKIAENGDTDKLKKWSKYRVLLSRVDTNKKEMDLPEKPN